MITPAACPRGSDEAPERLAPTRGSRIARLNTSASCDRHHPSPSLPLLWSPFGLLESGISLCFSGLDAGSNPVAPTTSPRAFSKSFWTRDSPLGCSWAVRGRMASASSSASYSSMYSLPGKGGGLRNELTTIQFQEPSHVSAPLLLWDVASAVVRRAVVALFHLLRRGVGSSRTTRSARESTHPRRDQARSGGSGGRGLWVREPRGSAMWLA